jgi:(2Fe-2S) ferredoxin
MYYERLDVALLDRILDEHILQGVPISTHCLLQRSPAPARNQNGTTSTAGS